MNKNIHEQIKEKLNNGERVFSLAFGRVGEVVAVRGDKEGKQLFPIEICLQSRSFNVVKSHRHIHAATNFLVGDAVKLRKRGLEGGEFWTVINADWDRW